MNNNKFELNSSLNKIGGYEEVLYKQKYLKYKQKYSELKAQMGGVVTDEEATNIINEFKKENPNIDYIKYFIEKLPQEDDGNYFYTFKNQRKVSITLQVWKDKNNNLYIQEGKYIFSHPRKLFGLYCISSDMTKGFKGPDNYDDDVYLTYNQKKEKYNELERKGILTEITTKTELNEYIKDKLNTYNLDDIKNYFNIHLPEIMFSYVKFFGRKM